MQSYAIVTLQLALIAAIALPWRAAGWNAAGTVLVLLAVLVGAWALTANRPGRFNIRPEPKPGSALVTSGPYRFVRHPMYLSVLLFTAGCVVGYADYEAWRAADVARIGAWLALACVLLVKASIEETLLRALHPQYDAYAHRTKRIVPFVL